MRLSRNQSLRQELTYGRWPRALVDRAKILVVAQSTAEEFARINLNNSATAQAIVLLSEESPVNRTNKLTTGKSNLLLQSYEPGTPGQMVL